MSNSLYEYFDVSRDGNVALFTLTTKELRHPQAAQQFGADVRAALQELGLKNAVIDMSRAEYLGSTAFATLISLARGVAEAGGRLKLCDLHPDVRIGANILGLGNAVELHESLKSALESFTAD